MAQSDMPHTTHTQQKVRIKYKEDIGPNKSNRAVAVFQMCMNMSAIYGLVLQLFLSIIIMCSYLSEDMDKNTAGARPCCSDSVYCWAIWTLAFTLISYGIYYVNDKKLQSVGLVIKM